MLEKINILPLLSTAAICDFLHRFPFYVRLHSDCEPVEGFKKKKSIRLICNFLSLLQMPVLPRYEGFFFLLFAFLNRIILFCDLVIGRLNLDMIPFDPLHPPHYRWYTEYSL